MAGGSRDATAAQRAGLRWVLAPNASALTLDGTRTYLIGSRRVAVIDPGPDDAAHLDRLAHLVGDAEAVVLLTHTHADHAEGADALARRLGAETRGVAAGTLSDGDEVPTDMGQLVAWLAPGHTPDHAIFHWPREGAVFCGDLMTGGEETALVAPPEGDLGQYLRSLDLVRRLEPRVIFPAHGPEFGDPSGALAAYVGHRAERVRQVAAALEAGAVSLDAIVERVYGPRLPAALREAAKGSVLGYVEHLRRLGGVDASLLPEAGA